MQGLLHKAKHAWLLSLRVQHVHCCMALLHSASRLPAGLLLSEINPYIHTMTLLYNTFLFTCNGLRFTKHIHIKFVGQYRQKSCQPMCAFYLMASHVTNQLAHGPTHDTVKCIYFVGCIYCGFRELSFIHKINLQQKLFHHHVICTCGPPVHKLAQYKYFKKAPSALPNPSGSQLCCWKPFLQLVMKCQDWLAKIQGRTVRP